jgi:DNA phosphorothioation-dependent restriction protein DptG
MKYTNVEVAKQIVLSYLENLANKDTITYESLNEVIAIKSDKTNKILLEHIKAIKNIMENAIKDLESKGE